MEILMIIMIITTISISYVNFMLKNRIKLLNTQNLTLKNEKSELEKKKVILEIKNKKLLLDNGYLTLSMIETSRVVKKIMSINPKNTMGEFDDDFSNPNILDKTIKNKYTIDDILTEIGEVGISNISKEKLEFLNKNK